MAWFLEPRVTLSLVVVGSLVLALVPWRRLLLVLWIWLWFRGSSGFLLPINKALPSSSIVIAYPAVLVLAGYALSILDLSQLFY